MVNLSSRYANAILEYGEEHGVLDRFYREVLSIGGGTVAVNFSRVSTELAALIELIPDGDRAAVLRQFVDMARERLGMLNVEVISAVPLTQDQLANLEIKLIHLFRKQLEITTRVDPALLGGLRIIAGSTIIDDTIKRKLSDMKKLAYKGVYFNQ